MVHMLISATHDSGTEDCPLGMHQLWVVSRATMTILQAFKTHCSLLAVLKVEFLTYSRTSGYLEV